MKSNYGWILVSALLISGAFYSLGCGKTDVVATAAGGAGSCTIVSGGTLTSCIDYTGAGYTSSTAQSSCSQSSGTYSASACTSTGRIGTCKLYGGQATELNYRYLTGFDSSSAPAACSAQSGTYTAG